MAATPPGGASPSASPRDYYVEMPQPAPQAFAAQPSHPQAASSLGPQESYETLRQNRKLFKVLSGIKKGERICRGENGAVVKFENPETRWQRLWQAMYRGSQGQNTENDLLTLKLAAEQATKCMQNPPLLEILADYHGSLDLIYKIRKYAQGIVAGKGFQEYEKTCTQGIANLVELSEEKRRARARLAGEVSEALIKLDQAVNGHVAYLEGLNENADLQHCFNYFELLAEARESFQRKFKFLYQNKPMPGRVCNSAAKKALKECFEPSLIEKVYTEYRLDHLGTVRLQDLYALLVGSLAALDRFILAQDGKKFSFHPNTFDLSTYTHSNKDEAAFCLYLDMLRRFSIEKINPLPRYQAQFKRDIQFLIASRSSLSNGFGNERLGKAMHFSNPEHMVLDLAPAFENFSEAPFTGPLVYPTHDKSGALKCMEVYPISHNKTLFALALIPRFHQGLESSLQLVIMDSDCMNSSGDISTQLSRLAGLSKQRALEHGSFTLEFIFPYQQKMTEGRSIDLLCKWIKANSRELFLRNLKIIVFGRMTVSAEVSKCFLDMAQTNPLLQVHVRYMLFNELDKTNLQGVFLGATSKGRKHDNLAVSLFYLKRERDYPENSANTKIKRLFLKHDEQGNDNLTTLSSIVTNSKEDAALILNGTIVAMDKINDALAPPPPVEGILSSTWSSVANTWDYYWRGGKAENPHKL